MMLKIKIKASLIALSILLVSCGPKVTPPTTPSVVPVPAPAPGVAPGTVIAPAPVTTKLEITVVDQTTKAAIPNAQVKISGSTFESKEGQTDTNGFLTFEGMRIDTEYNIVIQATNFKSYTDQIGVNQLSTISTKDGLKLGVALKPAIGITGTVQDASGKPLSQAVIYDGKESYLTDEKGQFNLVQTELEMLNLNISKQGYQSQNKSIPMPATTLPTIQLVAKVGPVRVLLDGSKRPLSMSNGLSRLAVLTQTLTNDGFQVQSTSTPTLPSLDNVDILVIPSPSLAYIDSEINSIVNFVLGGKKLIVLGEWGGFGGSNIDTVNAILSRFNLKMGGDTLRENNSGFLAITHFDKHPITQSLQSLKLYQSSSVELITSVGNHNILARTSPNGFKIANTTGAFGVLGAVLSGTGKVIAVGDTSLWLDEDSDANGTKNILEANNLQLAQAIFNW